MMRLCAAIAALAVPLALAGAAPAADAGKFISVEGIGEVFARPDVADVTAGVTSRAATARAAVNHNNAAMPVVLALLRDMGVAEADIQTRGFSVAPFYSRTEPGHGTPEIAGYQVSNRIEVTVRALAKLGSLLDRLVDSGANTIHGIRFRIGEPGPLLDRARQGAVEDARNRAALYARAAGVNLGAVLRIEERAVRVPQPRMMASSEARALSTVPVAPGEQQIRATVGVTFAIE